MTCAHAWTREADARETPRGPPSVDRSVVRRLGPGPARSGRQRSCHVDSDLQLPRPRSDGGAEGRLHVGDGVDVADMAVLQARVCREIAAGVRQHPAPLQGDARAEGQVLAQEGHHAERVDRVVRDAEVEDLTAWEVDDGDGDYVEKVPFDRALGARAKNNRALGRLMRDGRPAPRTCSSPSAPAAQPPGPGWSQRQSSTRGARSNATARSVTRR